MTVQVDSMSLKISLQDIPENGAEYTINDESWFPDSEIDRVGSAAAVFRIDRHGSRFRCAGRIDVTIRFCCDRCLEDFEAPVVAEFDLLLDPEPEGEDGDDSVCSEDDMEILPVEGMVFDVADFLQQQIFLSLPIKMLCHDACQGLCGICGCNLNVNRCQCKSEIVTPFSGLKKLLQD